MDSAPSDTMFEGLFYASWIFLIGAPVAAFSGFLVVRRLRPHLVIRVAIGSALLLLLIVAVIFARISTISVMANFATVGGGYFLYCLLAACAWAIRPLAARITAGSVMSVPILVGYILGTIGAMGLGFIVGDYAREPQKVAKVAPGLTCRITQWGAVVSDEGYTVHLYRYWTSIPFFQKEVRATVIDETNPGSGPASASCESEYSAYAQARQSL